MRTRIKICGLTSPEEAAFLSSNQVDYAGMVLFYPKSRRNITIEKAREIMRALPPEVKKTAVTVSPTLEQVKLIEEADFDVLQIHGHLAEDISAEASIPIIRAVNVKDRVPVMESYPRIFAYLFDAAAPGSGKSFDWSCLAHISAQGRKLILAGGLHPFNVGDAIRQVHPWMVDVSSGVEYDDKQGKDPVKIQAFIEAVKEADEKSS